MKGLGSRFRLPEFKSPSIITSWVAWASRLASLSLSVFCDTSHLPGWWSFLGENPCSATAHRKDEQGEGCDYLSEGSPSVSGLEISSHTVRRAVARHTQ